MRDVHLQPLSARRRYIERLTGKKFLSARNAGSNEIRLIFSKNGWSRRKRDRLFSSPFHLRRRKLPEPETTPLRMARRKT